ncbi:unnamed protein product [Lactuca virosa]|uniref:Replication factor A C-terminal domain-containing protein n=1 Tax=Lactuca virosa TaxID=75947 RepID=A0AAU9PD37_9ASTR|nr:unnamed protein product [Lactuca virosa]
MGTLIQHRPYVNNTYLVTKLLIEEVIEEITSFKKRYQFYNACTKCKSKVQILKVLNETEFEEKEILVCQKDNCKGKEVIVELSFMIKVRVQGLVGVVSLTMFDREVRNLLKIYVPDLLSRYEKDMDNDSIDVIDSEFASQDTMGCKGANSHTADNTHVSNIPSRICTSPSSITATNKLNSSPTSVKCKLVDVYDLDDNVYESATKPNAPRNGDDKVGGTTKLLISKLKK